ncbi:MAG: FKBP-type peptidyl-prolyl cis-trans isomerase [Ilumatobacteraceae bacterium]
MRFRPLLLSIAALGLLAACGDNASSSSDTTAAPTITVAGAIPKPEVKLPGTLPTALVLTDLTAGTGAEVVSGDTVVVHYVGVRSADGAEFDNSYDRGSPVPVTVGVGQVIKGWDEGLVGMKQGGRRQLDIPADLAYGDSPPGTEVIQPGDALSFVIDVVAIIPKPDPADAPTISIPATPNQTEQTFTDLVVGDGVGIEPGQTVAVQLVAFSAADGKQLDSSWTTGTPLTFVPGAGTLPPGLEKAVDGMKVGGRRQVDIPFADAFGEAGNTNLGLPASTDLIMVLDLVAVY